VSLLLDRMRTRGWIVAGAVWGTTVVAGFGVLASFGNTPGAATLAPASWPADSALARATDRPTLLTFVHPHCACSRATLRELDRLAQRLRGRVAATILFAGLDGVAEDRTSTELRALAESVEFARVVDDPGGREAARFGGTTSGFTLLYDADGALRFSGGLTAGRGQEGDSFGRARIIELVERGRTDRPDSPVFGCPLRDPTTDGPETPGRSAS
jgi:hypothetical protein